MIFCRRPIHHWPDHFITEFENEGRVADATGARPCDFGVGGRSVSAIPPKAGMMLQCGK
jgi:hypothetical protein